MSIRQYLDEQVSQGSLIQISLCLLGRYRLRIFHHTESLASDINELVWPHETSDVEQNSTHTIYALNGQFTDEQIEEYNCKRRSLIGAKGDDSYSDALALTPPLLDIISGGWVISHRFKRTIYALNPKPDHLALDVLRAIHQVLAFSVSKEGGYIFHASSVELNGRATLFIGECGSGKTTLSLAAAKRGLRYITNDTAILRKAGLECTVQGWPEGVNLVRPGLPQKDMVPLVRQFEGRTELFAIGEVPLRNIVFPEVSSEPREAEVIELNAEYGNERLSKGLLPHGKFGQPPWSGLGDVCRFFSVKCSYDQADTAVDHLMSLIGEEAN